MAETPPYQRRLRQFFHLRHNAGPGGGETGHNLIHGVHKAGNLPAEHERKTSEHAEHQPAQGHSHKAFSGEEYLIFRFFPGKDHPENKADRRHGQVAEAFPLAVDQGRQYGHRHEQPFHLQDPSQHIYNDTQIHTPTILSQDIFQIVQTRMCGDHNHRIACLQRILASRHDDGSVAVDAGQQQIFL